MIEAALPSHAKHSPNKASQQSIAEFVSVLKKSGIIAEKDWDVFLKNHDSFFSGTSSRQSLVNQLIRSGLMTNFQASQLQKGIYRGFIINEKFKVLEPLGRGGMGTVYLCEHVMMRRLVALKVLPRDQANNQTAVDRFYREARAVASLDHPNIVRAYDAERSTRIHYLVMEFVDGVNLSTLVSKSGATSIALAADCIRQAAIGLQKAHELGWIHRDIKPANLLLDRQGVVKILDLGLARLFTDNTEQITQNGGSTVLGTADFMAPEQAHRASEIDTRADIFSLGATLYFLLTGHLPFPKESLVEKLVSVYVDEVIPVTEFRSDVPEKMLQVLDQMIAKDPENRIQTAGELVEIFSEWSQPPIPLPKIMPEYSEAIQRLVSKDANSVEKRSTVPDMGPDQKQRATRQTSSKKPNTKSFDVAGKFSSSRSGGKTVVVKMWPKIVMRTMAQLKRYPKRYALAGVVFLIFSTSICFSLLSGSRSSSRLDAKTNQSISSVPLAWDSTAIVSGNTLYVSKSGKSSESNRIYFGTVLQALKQAKSGDRIQICDEVWEENLLISGDLAKQVTIEPASDISARPIWRGQAGSNLPIVRLAGATGVTISGFIFDGASKSEHLMTIAGRSPGLQIRDTVMRGFVVSAIAISDALGESDEQILLQNIHVTTDGLNRESAIVFQSTGDAGNQHVFVDMCRFDGPFRSVVRVTGATTYVELNQNRCFQCEDAIEIASAGKAFPVRANVVSNTFSRISRSVIHIEGEPYNSGGTQLSFRKNLFLETSGFVRSDKPIPGDKAEKLFAKSEGNVCHDESCHNYQVPYLTVKPLKFSAGDVSKQIDTPSFLMYAATSQLYHAGPNAAAIGVPPSPEPVTLRTKMPGN